MTQEIRLQLKGCLNRSTSARSTKHHRLSFLFCVRFVFNLNFTLSKKRKSTNNIDFFKGMSVDKYFLLTLDFLGYIFKYSVLLLKI